MFLNYAAGAVSLFLAVSAFLPWVTVWFYSLKGIESTFGIVILLSGILGVLISVFQHLSGRSRGRAFIVLSLVSLACEALYFKKLADYGANLNEVVGLLKDLFGEQVHQKLVQLLGEQWTTVLGKVVARMGVQTSVSSFDFIGGGLVVAFVCSLALFVTGILVEKTKSAD